MDHVEIRGPLGARCKPAKPLDTESPLLTNESSRPACFCLVAEELSVFLLIRCKLMFFQLKCSGDVQRESSGLLDAASSTVIVTVFETRHDRRLDRSSKPWAPSCPAPPRPLSTTLSRSVCRAQRTDLSIVQFLFSA